MECAAVTNTLAERGGQRAAGRQQPAGRGGGDDRTPHVGNRWSRSADETMASDVGGKGWH